MKTSIQTAFRFLFVTVLLVFGFISSIDAADLEKISQAQLISNPANDGDSFFVKAHEKTFCVRLYFVDCPETSTGSPNDAQRVREQARYFGLSDPARIVHFGNEAKMVTEHFLANRFTVHTAFASAGGRVAQGRVYGVITTNGTNDLASLLS